jgi:hypothetical protein
MKNLLILLSFVVAILLVACSDDAKIMISANPTAPALSAPTHLSPSYNTTSGAYILSKDSASNIIETFKGSAANYGANAKVTYTLQIDKAGNNFANAQNIITSTKDTLAITVSQLNTPIASEGLLNSTPGTVASFDVRVMATIGIGLQSLYSNVVTIKVNPYPTYGLLYVPGDYQGTYAGGNWNPANPNTILYSSANNGKYDGFLDMSNGGAAASFKFAEKPDWSLCWKPADIATSKPNSTFALIHTDGDPNISLPSGYYKFNVDLNAKTCTNVAITKWGVIGSFAASGWSNEVNMLFDATTKLWSATVTFAAGDKFKIRANGAWDVAFGYDAASGKYTTSGGDIPVTAAGTYTVTLDVRQYGKPGYNVILTKQ